MAKTKIADIESKIKRPADGPRYVNLLIYARNKVGKTYFSAQAPNVLIADPEHGTDALVKTNPAVFPVDSWEDVDEFYRYLKAGKHDYEWAVCDSFTRMHNMALRFVMKLQEERDLDRIPGMVRRQDYGKAGELTKGMLYNFLSLPMNVIFTCQERTIEVSQYDDEEGDELGNTLTRVVPDLPNSARSAINGVVDLIGRMYVERIKVRVKGSKEIREIDQRRLWVAPHEAYDTGYRSDYKQPDFIKNPTPTKLVDMMLGTDAE